MKTDLTTEANLYTGYFANEKTFTQVHIVKDNKPICGANIGADKKFQLNAHGVFKSYLECEHCRKKIAKIMKKILNPDIKLEAGTIVKLKRKPTNENNATVVFRGIKSVDYKKKIISCDDNIDYKFKDIISK
ncbi:MAG: hypothetical protein WC428_02005 [Candidatus Paceibacterota bacterium]